MERSIEFEKTIEKGKGYLIAAIIFFLIPLVVAGGMYFYNKNGMKNPAKLIDVTEEDVYASVKASMMTDYFATNDDNGVTHKTYFVLDEDNIMYIVDIDSESRERLQKIYDYTYNYDEDLEAPESVELKGMTKEIPSDLKKIAIEAYNQLMGEDYLNTTNFYDNLGAVYLDTHESPMSNLASVIVIALPFGVIGLIFIITYFVNSSKTKKTKQKYADNWDKIIDEINNSDTLYYKSTRLYLTRNYLISCQNGLEIYDYNDIVWIYPHEYRHNGIVTQRSVYVVTRNSKVHNMATLGTSKKNKILFEEIYNTLSNKMPDILKGYTRENIKAAKELYQK